jgi:hypothetical protein
VQRWMAGTTSSSSLHIMCVTNGQFLRLDWIERKKKSDQRTGYRPLIESKTHSTQRKMIARRSSCRNRVAKQLMKSNGVTAIICHRRVARTRSSICRMDALSKSCASGRNSDSRGDQSSSSLAASARHATASVVISSHDPNVIFSLVNNRTSVIVFY